MIKTATAIGIFCLQFTNIGAHPGAHISGEQDEMARRLVKGFDARHLCQEAIEDCLKWTSVRRCFGDKKIFWYDSTHDGYPRNSMMLINDIGETVGFAPADVQERFHPADMYWWRPLKKRKIE